jgi:hypothetical protein
MNGLSQTDIISTLNELFKKEKADHKIAKDEIKTLMEINGLSIVRNHHINKMYVNALEEIETLK